MEEESIPPTDSPLLDAYDDPEVQAYLDTLFLEGRLRPARLLEPAEVYGWMQVGVLFDEAAYRRRRLQRLMAQVESAISGTEFDYRDWLAFAPRWAEALRLRWEVDPSGEDAERFEHLHERMEERFAAWLQDRYATLATVPPIPAPVMGHRVAETLAYQRRQGMERIALVVVYGLAWDQWLVLRDALGLEPLSEADLEEWGIDTRVQAVGIVLTQVDRMAHGEQLGVGGLHRSVRQWAENGVRGPAGLLDRLRETGFACWLTSDHGNLEAVGIGTPREGVLVEQGGHRVRIYDDEGLRERARAQVSPALTWTPEGLPEGLCLLLASGRKAFLPLGKRAICHGGIALEEVVVPFVRLF